MENFIFCATVAVVAEYWKTAKGLGDIVQDGGKTENMWYIGIMDLEIEISKNKHAFLGAMASDYSARYSSQVSCV